MYVWLPYLLTPVGQTKEVHAVSSADSAVRCRRWMFRSCPIKMQRNGIISVSCDVCVSSPNIRNVNTESSFGLSLKRTLQESYTKAGFFVWVSTVSGYLQQKGDSQWTLCLLLYTFAAKISGNAKKQSPWFTNKHGIVSTKLCDACVVRIAKFKQR